MMLIYLIQVLNLVSTAYGASTDSGPTTSAIQTPNDGNANSLSGTLQYVVIGLAIVFGLLLFACFFMVYKKHRNERELLNSNLKIDGSKNMSGSNILLEHMNQINYDSDIGAQGARKTEVIRTGTADSNAPLLRGTTGTSDGGVNPSRGDTRELPQNYPPTENIKQLSSLAETSEFPPDSVVRSTNNQTTEPVDTSNIESTNPVINGSQTGLLSGGDSNVRSPPSNLSPEQSTVPPSVGQNTVATGFGSPLVPIAERTEEGQNSDMGYSNMASSDALASGYTGTSPQFQSNINPDATSTQFVDMLGRRQSKQQGGNRDNNGNQFFEASPLRRGSAVPNVNPNLPPKANYATLTEIHGTLVAYDQAVVPIAFDYSIPLYLQCEEHDVALQTSIWEDASAKMYAAAYGSPDFLELAQGLTKFLVKNLKDDVVSEKMFYKEVVLTNNLLKHPNFIKIIAYTARPKMIVYPFYDNGTLKAVYLDKTRFPSIYWNSAFIGAFFYDIANGLQTLHDHGVSHNDLRPSNVYVDIHPDGNRLMAVIGELGCTTMVDNHHENNLSVRFMIKKGLPITYMPPEVVYSVRNKLPLFIDSYNLHTWDSFSFGISLFEVVVRNRAYGDMNRAAIEIAVSEGVRPAFPSVFKTDQALMSEFEHLRSIITACWSVDAFDRPTMSTLVKELQYYHDLHYAEPTESQAAELDG